jgi:tetratricopeptide (TPR) repeat protein
MVRSTEEYLDQLARDSRNDPRVLSALATAYVRVGEVQGNPDFTNLGDSPGAFETYHKALHVLDPLLYKDPENRKLLELSEEAHLGIAYLEGGRGSNEKAEVEARAAIEISRKLLAANPRDPGARLRFLTAQSVRLKHYPSGREGAEEEARRYLPEAIQLARENPQDVSIQSNLAAYYNLLGAIAGRREALEESLSYYRKCIALREQAARLQPRNPTVLRELAVSYGQAGDFLGSPIYVNLGDFQGALKYFRQEAKIVEELSRSDPSDQRARYDTGMAWMRIGVTLQAKGNLAESNRALERSTSEFGSMQGGVPDQLPYQRALGLVYEYKGRNSSMLGDRRGAMEWYRKSLALAGEQLRKDPRDMPAKRQSVESGGRLAVLLAFQGDIAGAQQLIERVLKAAEGTPVGWHGLAWKFQAQVYEIERNCPAAAQSFQKAISIWASDPSVAKSPQHPAELREAQSGLKQCSSKAPN